MGFSPSRSTKISVVLPYFKKWHNKFVNTSETSHIIALFFLDLFIL